MKTLTQRQIEIQDFVDNRIYQLIQQLNPSEKEIKWDIEMIGDVRDCIQDWLVNRLKITNEKEFYPFL